MTAQHDGITRAPGVALVIGGAGGIGAAVCRSLAELGNSVAFVDTTPEFWEKVIAVNYRGTLKPCYPA